MKRLVVPKFETEAEEAEWWDAHMDVVGENLIEAMQNGSAHRGGPAALLRETRALQLRIPKTDIERVEKVADRRGFSSIQGCINALLHEALDREEEQERRKAG